MKMARTVLRGEWLSDMLLLPDFAVLCHRAPQPRGLSVQYFPFRQTTPKCVKAHATRAGDAGEDAAGARLTALSGSPRSLVKLVSCGEGSLP